MGKVLELRAVKAGTWISKVGMSIGLLKVVKVSRSWVKRSPMKYCNLIWLTG
jgi:hypothetical protein